jgi:phosphoribosyl-AMP cyclohydrolase / phosphoribosyl-ATP pyrophosphohydrolase
MNFDLQTIDFQRDTNGLVAAIVQDATSRQVLMLGYMNREAVEKTLSEGNVTFFSDGDALLIRAEPIGPTCHTGAATCWQEENDLSGTDFLMFLEKIIQTRKAEDPSVSKSYTNSLFQKGINKIAQKVGEEAVELVIEAKDDNKELFLGEAADLLFHYLVLLAAKDFTLDDVLTVLKKRHK